MNHKMDKAFEKGFEEYVLDMKARNLRQGTKPLSRCNKADLQTNTTINDEFQHFADVYWSDKTWYYSEAAEVYIEPKSQGVSVLTFTNDADKSAFRVLVIVT